MRIAVLSDIHANSVALDAVLADAGAVDAVWHLGDVVGYGPDPDGVVERLRDVGATGVQGNHDSAAIGLLDIDAFNPDARAAMEWTRRRIGHQTRAWLEGLPRRAVDGALTLVHGSPRDPIWEYVVSAGIARENLAAFATPHCLHGHTHVPILFRDSGGRRMEMLSPAAGATVELDERRVMLNPGSVGQPRDGLPTASYLILEPEARQCTWHRVAYDIPAVQHAMDQARLPARLIARLQFGL
jgi:predicted phosphodiesterase